MWVRRNLRNLAHSGSGSRHPDSQNQPKADEIQVSRTLEQKHTLLSSVWPFHNHHNNEGYLPRKPPFVTHPTTSYVFRAPVQTSLRQASFTKLQLSPPWTRAKCGREAGCPMGQPTGGIQPSCSLNVQPPSFSTDSLPKLTVAV